jgi:hypothetical protein
MAPTPRNHARPVKEKFYVRIPIEQGPVLFCDATAYIGKEMPYSKPQATCAMRVEADAVYFSLLHISRKMATEFAARPIKIPRGPVVKMQKGLQGLEIESPDVWVEIELGDEQRLLHRYHIVRDENSVGRLEIVPGFGSGDDASEDPTFDLPTRSVEIRLYLRAPKLNRHIAVNFIGHIGKPRTPETVGRAAAMVLNSMSGLAEFRQIAGIEAMRVPAPPAKWAARPAPRRDEERVVFSVPMHLFAEDYQPVGAGDLTVEVDLESINQATGRLLFHVSVPEHLEARFNETYRATIVDIALVEAMRRELGDDMDMIVYEIMLGEVGLGTVERLRNAAKTIHGVDATPREYRLHDPAAPVA